MNLTSDLPFWTVRNGLLQVYPAPERDLHCDALVLGGGISGALLSHRLVKAGVDCVLIDGREIAHGSTSASTALLQYEIDTPLHRLRKHVTEASAERAYTAGVESIHNLQKLSGKQCGFVLRPSLQIATRTADLAGLRIECEQRRKIELPVSLLSRSDLRDLGIDGAGALRSAIAAEVDPYRLTHRLLQRSVYGGLRIFDRTATKHYTQSKNHVIATTDRGFKIRCRNIFFATGYETMDILPAKLVTLKSTYALVSEPGDLSWWPERSLIWGTGDPYFYMRTTSDNRILVGGEDDGILQPQHRDKQIPAKTSRLVRRFHALFPRAKIEPAFAWAGVFGSTRDGLAYIGAHPSFPRAYFALGFGGNGITFCEIASRILTDLFLGRKNADAKVFAFDR